ncbi:MAG: outer membrane beta-barrel protein, partial [Saprospiraceae bacterium]|nr:outer membrane beta-barrel protein [Saprospiraceae bacterium]
MLLRNTHLLCLLAFCLSANVTWAQKIKGQLIQSNGDAAEFMNVLLLQQSDSAVVKLELSDEDGKYSFSKVDQGDYLIKVTGIGVSDAFSEPFTLADEDVTVPVIELTEFAQDLETVEVTAKKPLLEQRAGRLVVNVDQSITGKGGSVTDLLKKVPGLLVVNDRVSMAGRSGVTILIDGRPTKYMDIESLLREMPADNIEKIEVISQPGAAFDAEGTGGVINIILKKNTLLGTNGTVSLGGGYGEVERYRGSVSLNHRVGPWNLSAYAGYGRNNWNERLDLTRILPDAVYDQVSKTPGRPHSGRVRLGADYEISDAHKTGITVSAAGGINNRTGTNTTIISDLEGQMLQTFTNLNVQERDWRSVTADAFYQWKIDTTGQRLSIDANFASYNRAAINDLIVSDATIPNRRNNEPAETNIYSAQLDYKLPFGESFEFQTGVKASFARLDNELKASIWVNDDWINDV